MNTAGNEIRILMVDDNNNDAELITRALKNSKLAFVAKHVQNREAFTKELSEFSPDIVLSDYTIGNQFTGLDAIHLVKSKSPCLPVILITGTLSDETAVECMKAGAWDYVIKDRLSRLPSAIASALERKHSHIEKFQAEQNLKDTLADLRRSNEELQAFAFVASHDLQAPLRTIASFSELVRNNVDVSEKPELAEYLDFLLRGTREMKVLVESLLAYSRVGRNETELETVDLKEVVRECLEMRIVPEDQITVICEDLPTVLGHPLEIKQLFQNLIQNAYKFRNRERSAEVRISAEANDADWQISVSDNGIGIEPDYFEKIFMAFQRCHSIGGVEGSGIGLAISKKVVELHGGQIWVESKLGEGSTFHFTFSKRGPSK